VNRRQARTIAIAVNEGVVANSSQQAVGNSWGPATSSRDLVQRRTGDVEAEQ
jgi:hypothetical protein